MMDFKKYITVKKGFQSSVNIAYDLYHEEKIEDFIPTTASLDILKDLLLGTYASSTDRAKILIGAYGKGKSHIVLLFLSLLQNKNRKIFETLLKKIKEYDDEFYQYAAEYIKSNKKLLSIVIEGSSVSLTQSFLGGLQKKLQEENLSHLMPETHFQAALAMIDRWKEKYPQTYIVFVEFLNMPIEEYRDKLESYDTDSYEFFVKVYPSLTSGSEFNPFIGFDVVELYSKVNDALIKEGYQGLYVVYDEFSKYLESSIAKTSIEDITMLQKFAEKSCRSKEKQMHLLLITHKDIANYIDRLPKEKVDGWKGVSERFKHIEVHNNFSQIYEVIGTVIQKDEKYFKTFFNSRVNEFMALKNEYDNNFIFSDLSSEEREKMIYNCYPLHPITTFILPRLSELVAQNERTLFTFLSSNSKNTLVDFLENKDQKSNFLTPDRLYDYFEMLFRQEPHTSEIRKIYLLTISVLAKLENLELESKIVKTIALIYIINQFEKLAPTADTIIQIYKDDVDDMSKIITALTVLKDNKYVVYQNQSNHYLRLKDSLGIDVRKKCIDYIENKRNVFDYKQILAEVLDDVYFYPTQYNDDRQITRFFECKFITAKEFREVKNWTKKIDGLDIDGIIYAILPSNSADIAEVEKMLLDRVPEQGERIVFALPTEYVDIEESTYAYQAIQDLKKKIDNDVALLEEYNIYLEDIEKLLKRVVLSYVKPELRKVTYYCNGKKQTIYRKSQLSQCLSSICERFYTQTPVIINEVLNKNELTSTAISSRNKVINGLLANYLEPNLGLKGSSQEISFYRSALLKMGLIEGEEAPVIVLHDNENVEMQNVITIIEDFFINADGSEETSSFAVLYHKLRYPEYHIGLKKGVIPIYIACVLHQYKNYLVIKAKDVEFPVSVDLLNSINEEPEKYVVYMEQWSSDKNVYIKSLEEIFSSYVQESEKEYNAFSFIVSAMQRWLIRLPKYVKETTKDYSGLNKENELDKTAIKYIKSLKNPSVNAREYLFEKAPVIFNYNEFNINIVENILKIKNIIDGLKSSLVQYLVQELIDLFGDNIMEETSLCSALRDWCESLKQSTAQHVFEGSYFKVFQLIQSASNDTEFLVERLAKAITGLRIDDWNDEKVEFFLSEIKNFKNVVEKYNEETTDFEKTSLNEEKINDSLGSEYKISFVNESGKLQMRSFNKIPYKSRASLLKNDIEDSLESMGESISIDEKRQVLMEILEKMF